MQQALYAVSFTVFDSYLFDLIRNTDGQLIMIHEFSDTYGNAVSMICDTWDTSNENVPSDLINSIPFINSLSFLLTKQGVKKKSSFCPLQTMAINRL